MKELTKITLPEEPLEKNETALALSEEKLTEPSPFLEKINSFIDRFKEKPFPWKSINIKGAVIAGCLVVIALAGYLNIRYGIIPLSKTPDTDATNTTATAPESDFFASAVIDRERARDEALEVLVGITEDEAADDASKANAFTKMEEIADMTSKEIDIENLIKAKGFSECLAVISDNAANIVVKTEGLSAAEIAQIKEIAYEKAGLDPKNVKIIEKLPQ